MKAIVSINHVEKLEKYKGNLNIKINGILKELYMLYIRMIDVSNGSEAVTVYNSK